jgi:N-acetylglutamate synthase-like GNAT family acetyltransferase
MLQIRTATLDDVPALTDLIHRALRALNAGDSDHPLGLDPWPIAAGTYLLAERYGEIVGCGGWSFRHAPYSTTARSGERAARLRALHVHPCWARGGLGRRLLRACEQAAREAGVRWLELLATPTGEPLYSACGFTPLYRVDLPLPGGLALPTIKMRKALAPRPI